jgi:SulP family sulfate permease
VLSGVTIGVLLLPQGLAYAALARQPEYFGLYTGFPAALYAVFGTSRQGAIGPQSIPALIISSSLAGVPDDEYVSAVAGVTLLSGLIMLAAGWLRLGFLVRFISRPVLSGFAAGSAVLTMASSLKDVIGVNVERHAMLYDTLAAIGAALPHTHLPTAALSAIAVALLLALPRAPWNKVLPAPLFVTMLSIAFMGLWLHFVDHVDFFGPNARGAGGGSGSTNATDYDDDVTITDFSGPFGIQLVGAFPTSLPAASLPALPLDRLPLLLTTAVTVTLVGFIESVAVAKMYAQLQHIGRERAQGPRLRQHLRLDTRRAACHGRVRTLERQ